MDCGHYSNKFAGTLREVSRRSYFSAFVDITKQVIVIRQHRIRVTQ